jgi:hypothetical protein
MADTIKLAKDLKVGDVVYSNQSNAEMTITGIKEDIYFAPMVKHDVIVISWDGGSFMCYPGSRVIVKSSKASV